MNVYWSCINCHTFLLLEWFHFEVKTRPHIYFIAYESSCINFRAFFHQSGLIFFFGVEHDLHFLRLTKKTLYKVSHFASPQRTV